jgi:methylated-DNA-protein-cysteine methyltransferase-like protein
MAADFRERVIAALATVGPGEVVSYGDLAAEAGYPGAARGVGAVMAGAGPEEQLTWWRVVYSDGRLAPGKEQEQGRRLQAEGVQVAGGRVAARGGPDVAPRRARSSRGASPAGRRR